MIKMAYTDVYVTAILSQAPSLCVASKERQAYIERGKSEAAKREKYYVWKLLEHALAHSCGINIEALTFSREECGRWHTPACEFSLSHADGVVAVALSDAPIGVDVQRIAPPRHAAFARRVLTEAEHAHYAALDESERLSYLIGAWTAKEALFKMRREEAFAPSHIETEHAAVQKRVLVLNGVPYACALAADANAQVRFFTDVDLG